MRIGVLLFVGLGFLSGAACTSTKVIDADCIAAGGVCFDNEDPSGCGEQLPNGCLNGFICCTTVYAANIVDGSIRQDVANGSLPDGATDGEAGADSATDGAKDALTTDAAGKDAGAEAATDASSDAAKDATTHD